MPNCTSLWPTVTWLSHWRNIISCLSHQQWRHMISSLWCLKWCETWHLHAVTKRHFFSRSDDDTFKQSRDAFFFLLTPTKTWRHFFCDRDSDVRRPFCALGKYGWKREPTLLLTFLPSPVLHGLESPFYLDAGLATEWGYHTHCALWCSFLLVGVINGQTGFHIPSWAKGPLTKVLKAHKGSGSHNSVDFFTDKNPWIRLWKMLSFSLLLFLFCLVL